MLGPHMWCVSVGGVGQKYEWEGAAMDSPFLVEVRVIARLLTPFSASRAATCPMVLMPHNFPFQAAVMASLSSPPSLIRSLSAHLDISCSNSLSDPYRGMKAALFPLLLILLSSSHHQGGGTFSCSVNVPEASSAALLGLCSGPYSTKRAAKEAAAAAALGQLMQQLGRL